MKASHIALGILGGLAAGAVVGILFAPAKGTDTRKKIQQKGSDYADSLKGKLENLSSGFKKDFSNVVNNGKDLIAESKSKVDSIKNS